MKTKKYNVYDACIRLLFTDYFCHLTIAKKKQFFLAKKGVLKWGFHLVDLVWPSCDFFWRKLYEFFFNYVSLSKFKNDQLLKLFNNRIINSPVRSVKQQKGYRGPYKV